jgi:AcrR family transcriptional regulator|tara:strand:- start:664 stop:1263 length:600 start_codon:yes stop_codon:yes gene_type:complete
MITVSTSPEAYHHGNLRDALLAAGLAALEGAAGKAPSLRELARVVGVSATAVYRHFPDKQALDAALARAGLDLLGKEQAAAAERAGGGSQGFTETGRTYVRFALAHPALFRLMFTQGHPVDGSATPDEAYALLTANSRALVGDPDGAETLALQSWAMVHGIAMLMLDGRIPADDALIERLLDTGDLSTQSCGSSSEESP